MKEATKAYIAIIIQSLITGFSFLFVKIGLESADTVSLLAHRFTVAALCMLIYKMLRVTKISVDKKDWLKIIPLSFIYPIAFFLFQTIGLKMVSTTEAGIIQAVSPILTLIVARIILKEQITNLQKVFIVLSVSGVIFINLFSGFNISNYSYIGSLFILLSAISFALYNVLAKKMTKDYPVSTIVFIMSITGGIVFNLISVVMHLRNGNISSYFQPFTNSSFIWAVLYLGILSSLGSSLLSTYALGRLDASKVGLFANVATVVTIIAGTIFLQEILYWYHYIGIVAILGGTIAFNLTKNKKALQDKL